MPKTISIRKELIILVVIMVVAVALKMAFLHEPFERDEGWYATIAQEILHGGIPYRDAIEQKPPGVFYIFAAALALFGSSVEAVRCFTAAYSLLTLAAVYWLARYLLSPVAGLFAAAIFAVFSPAPLLQGSSSNSEVFLVLPLVLSVSCFVYGRDRNSRRLLAISGFMAGSALLIKQVALPYMLLLAVGACFFSPGERSWKSTGVNLAVFLFPQIVLALVVIGYFYLHGALHDFLFWNIKAPLIYARGWAVKGPALKHTLRDFSHELLLPFILAAVTAIWILLRKRSLNHLLVALLLPTSMVAALLPGMNFPHYFIQLVPFMAILGGIGLGRLFADSRVLFWCAMTLTLLLFGNYLRKDYPFFVTMSMEEVSVRKYGIAFVYSVKIADYIKQRTVPGDFIFQWGLEPELYFLSGRRSPTPYISSSIMNLQEDREGSILKLISALETKRPKYIIYQDDFADSPGLVDIRMLIERDYLLETTIGYGQIYRLRGV